MISFPTPNPSLIQQIENARQSLAAAKAAFSASMQSNMKGVFSDFMAKYPFVEKIVWKQYAPYFNDGEPCVFSVHDAEVFLVGGDYDEDYPEGETDWSLRRMIGSITENGDEITQEFYNDFKAISQLLQSDDDTMRDIFGSDSKVTVTRGGIDVDEYEHD